MGGAPGEFGNEAYRLYRAFLADLPCDCASVRSLVAQRARAAALEGFYGRLAAGVGLETEEGAKYAEQALKWSARAERLAVTSLDVSTRLAKAVGARPMIDLGRAIADASKERAR